MKVPPFQLERFFAEYEFSVEHLLCTSDCESVSIEELLSLDPAASASFQKQWLGYTESTGAPTLRQAIAGLYESVAPHRNLGIIHDNLELLDAFFETHEEIFRWVKPRAGSIAFPRFLQGSIDELVTKLVEGPGVLLAPGSVFGDTENHFRLGFGRKNLQEALARLEGFLREGG